MTILNIAHRGGAGLYPENTLAAFRNAIALGCDGAELDAQLSREGEVVVFHDFRLKPEICRDASGEWLTASGPLIKDLTLAELCRYDIGRANPASKYAQQHADVQWRDGERIPTLAKVVELAKRAPRPFRLFVELKSCFYDRALSADPVTLAEAVLKVVNARDYLQRTVLVGFDWPGLLHAKRIEPKIECWFTTQPQSWFGNAPKPEDEPPDEPVLRRLREWARTGSSPWAAGYDATSHGGSILRAVKAAGGDGWFPMHRDISSEAVSEARRLGLKIGAWTVNNGVEMVSLSRLGIDAICTDRPDLLAEVLATTTKETSTFTTA